MNSVKTTDTSLTITRLIPASVERVYEAWTTPELLAQWAAPEGIEHISYEVDLRVGGAYTEIDPPHRLAYTWDWKEDDYRMDVDTLVSVEFRSVGDATEVILTHDRFPVVDATKGHNEGWTSCLNRLEGLFA